MRRNLIAAGGILLALGPLLGGSPARAGELGWADPEGDATGFQVESTPRPPDPELDITKVAYSTDGKYLNLVWHLTKAVGDPAGSVGRDFDFFFTHNDLNYAFGAQLPTYPLDQGVLLTGPTFSDLNGTSAAQIPCGCKLRIDDKTNTMTFTVSYQDLDRAFPGTAKTGPGTKFTALRGRAGRIQGALIVPVDLTAPAEGAEFTF